MLLTGGRGFVGSYVLKLLHEKNVEVVTIGRNPVPGSVKYIAVDLLAKNDIAALIRNERPTHLLHFAWETNHGLYWNSPLNLRWLEATVRLTEAFCAAGGKGIVVSGTCAEYDWNYRYCREDSTPTLPTSLYGTTKDATRRLIEAICEPYGVPCAWARLFLPFGRGEAASRLIPSLTRVFRGEQAPFPIDTAVYRDFLHVSDVAQAFIRLLDCSANGAFNVSSGEPTRLADVVRMVAQAFDTDPMPILALSTPRVSEPPLLVGENNKLRQLGWKPILTIAETIACDLHEANVDVTDNAS